MQRSIKNNYRLGLVYWISLKVVEAKHSFHRCEQKTEAVLRIRVDAGSEQVCQLKSIKSISHPVPVLNCLILCVSDIFIICKMCLESTNITQLQMKLI